MIDKIKIKNSYRELPGLFYEDTFPDKVPSPKVVLFNDRLARTLKIEGLEKDEKLADILSGNIIMEGSEPIAQAYGGHQFGYFNILGDGRAVLLGEIESEGGLTDIQLKGSGRTSYSRSGDGKATLGSMLREYIISEAMHGLGIPTTGSLAVLETGETVYRGETMPGAILVRTAASHLRVGTFQYAGAKGNVDDLRQLTDYAIHRHYQELESIELPEKKYREFLRSVIKKQAETIVKWEMVGFIHGVMNTDNTTISGETIDYGPCAFMDKYDPATVFSSIDRDSRYAYGNQAYIGSWNLARLAETLLPLLSSNREESIRIAQEEISNYKEIHYAEWMRGMRRKLGLTKEENEDERLIVDLLKLMKKAEADFTNTFRGITLDEFKGQELFDTEAFKEWRDRYEKRLDKENSNIDIIKEVMKNSNPAIIPRNYLVENALEKAVKESDYEFFNDLLKNLQNPYEYSEEQVKYVKEPPENEAPYVTYCGT